MSMEAGGLFSVLLSGQTAPLPTAWTQLIYLRLGWALVLAALALWLVRRTLPTMPSIVAKSLAVALFGLTLLPGSVSPAYWLGLAFAAPSLMSCGLAILGLRHLWGMKVPHPSGISPGLPTFPKLSTWLLGAISAVGAVLLLDTFALFPFSLYALGFSVAAVGWVALIIALIFIAKNTDREKARLKFLALVVLVAYILLRLPSGNLWDALLDPWLWLVSVLALCARALGALQTRFSGSATTRA
jgi:hypothetical protein